MDPAEVPIQAASGHLCRCVRTHAARTVSAQQPVDAACGAAARMLRTHDAHAHYGARFGRSPLPNQIFGCTHGAIMERASRAKYCAPRNSIAHYVRLWKALRSLRYYTGAGSHFRSARLSRTMFCLWLAHDADRSIDGGDKLTVEVSKVV